MKKLVGLVMILGVLTARGQVDTSYVYNTSMPFGTLDIRVAKSATRYYYLRENETFSFRESSPGVKTNTYQNMTSWDSNPYTQGHLREKNGNADYFMMNYRLLFPANYNSSYDPGYPMIVMMHGAGERANCWDTNCYWSTRTWNPNANSPAAPTTSNHNLLNNDHNLSHGGSPHLTARNLAGARLPNDPSMPARAFPGFVLFGQCLNGWDTNSVQDLIRIVRLVSKKYNIDPDRIYIHGLSAGGAAVYDAVKRAPWLFSAALPMSAVSDASIISANLIPRVAHIPIWTFQGGTDTAPTPSRTVGYVNNFRNAGMSVRYSLYPTLGHGTWNTAYAEPDFFSWMLAKKKNNIHVPFNNPVICGTTGAGVNLGLSPGFLAYQWERDGVVIPGATASEYTATIAGVYRARYSRKANPSEADWNEWSQPVDVVENSPQKATIEVVGTQHMRGPDNNVLYNTVYLVANTHDKYYWYKDGVLINIPNTSLDDTTRIFRITSGSSSSTGLYTLQTKGNDQCPSPMSDPLQLFFANAAPLMTDNNVPTNFTGQALSAASVSLSWNDNSTIEGGYEIWRRKADNPFLLAGKTGPNETSFIDTRLEPSVTYEYKVRAISTTARSKYAPSNSVNTNLVITTQPDFETPSAASNLTVVGNTISSIALSWTAATDNTGIRRYHVSYGGTTVVTPDNATTFTLTELPANTAYYITVVAEDLGGNLSVPTPSVIGSTYVTGLIYGHSTGAWTSLDQIPDALWVSPEFTGTVPNFTLAPRTQEDFFNFEFKGYLYINNGGSYQFRTTSDDGSRLWLNNQLLVNNDGTHGNVTVTSASVAVDAGPQEINVRYFEYTGGQSLTVQYRGPDTNGAWVTIPNSALKSGSSVPVPAMVSANSIHAAIVAEETPGMSLTIYPNPASATNIILKADPKFDEPVEVSMLDLVGRSYYRQTFEANEVREGVAVKPGSNVLNGIYVLMVNQGGTLTKEKIVIRN